MYIGQLLQGQILWPQVSIPVDVATTDLTDKERKAIQAGSALLESLVASRGVEKDDDRRQRVARLIEHAHQRLSVQPGIPDISFPTRSKFMSAKDESSTGIVPSMSLKPKSTVSFALLS